MLSHFRMSVQECQENFERISSALFERERRISVFVFPWPKEGPKDSKYKLAAHVVDEFISEKMGGYRGSVQVSKRMKFQSPPDLCRT